MSSFSPNIKISNFDNKCPHGMPMGGCPTCSGGGGGGGSVRKKGEMSWDECYSIGLMLNAAKQNTELNKQANLISFNNSLTENKQTSLIGQKLAAAVNFISSRISVPVLNAINAVKENIFKPIVSVFTGISQHLSELAQNVKQLANKFVNIMDKLTAMFGEQEKAAKEFISNNLKKLKKKVFSLLAMIDGSMEQGEHKEEYVDENFIFKSGKELEDDNFFEI